MKAALLLNARRDYVRMVTPASELDEKGMWKHWSEMVAVISQPLHKRTAKNENAVIELARKFMPDLAFRWQGGTCCPAEDYGEYIWHYQVEMRQELLWNYPEFLAGWKFGLDPKEPHRDANPFAEPSRASSWDHGYILGLSAPSPTKANGYYTEDSIIKTAELMLKHKSFTVHRVTNSRAKGKVWNYSEPVAEARVHPFPISLIWTLDGAMKIAQAHRIGRHCGLFVNEGFMHFGGVAFRPVRGKMVK